MITPSHAQIGRFNFQGFGRGSCTFSATLVAGPLIKLPAGSSAESAGFAGPAGAAWGGRADVPQGIVR